MIADVHRLRSHFSLELEWKLGNKVLVRIFVTITAKTEESFAITHKWNARWEKKWFIVISP
jgi:hypothetical protein